MNGKKPRMRKPKENKIAEAQPAEEKIVSNPIKAAVVVDTTDPALISDGYHTFSELYKHRTLLFFSLAMALKARGHTVRWKPHYPGWPVLFIEGPTGQISYHFPEAHLDLIAAKVVRDDNHVWDGHTSENVLERLAALVGKL